jgi:hypothetical protein
MSTVVSCSVSGLLFIAKVLFICKTVASIGRREDFLHLTSFSIEEGSIPDGWPLVDILEKGGVSTQVNLISGGENPVENNYNGMI